MSDRELMQQALEAIERSLNYFDQLTYLREQTAPLRNKLLFSSQDLRARLAEPDDEPVAFVHWPVSGSPRLVWYSGKALEDAIRRGHEGHPSDMKLYTRPAARKVQPLTDEKTPMDAFENAIRRVGVVAACEWFGHASDSEFTKETIRVLCERAHGITGDSHE